MLYPQGMGVSRTVQETVGATALSICLLKVNFQGERVIFFWKGSCRLCQLGTSNFDGRVLTGGWGSGGCPGGHDGGRMPEYL